MSKKDKLISVDHLKWNVGGIKCGTLSVDYLNWILDHEEPAVDAVPVRHGKWIHRGCGIFACSKCGKDVGLNVYTGEKASERFRFCPNCGARISE